MMTATNNVILELLFLPQTGASQICQCSVMNLFLNVRILF